VALPTAQTRNYEFAELDLFKNFKIWRIWTLPYEDTLEDRRARADLIEVYKTVYGHLLKLNKKRIRTDSKHLFSKRVANWWNKLEKDTVGVKMLNQFKRIWKSTTKMSHFIDCCGLLGRLNRLG